MRASRLGGCGRGAERARCGGPARAGLLISSDNEHHTREMCCKSSPQDAPAPRHATGRRPLEKAHTPAISAKDGHAAVTRPVSDGSATATLAARLATLPTTRAPTQHAAPAARPRVGKQSSRRRDDHAVHR